MLKFLINRMVAVMRIRYNYDSAYLQEVASVSSGGAICLMLLPLVSQYRAGGSVDL
jgi:hypothetical protein